jgi:hypothetical protein
MFGCTELFSVGRDRTAGRSPIGNSAVFSMTSSRPASRRAIPQLPLTYQRGRGVYDLALSLGRAGQ